MEMPLCPGSAQMTPDVVKSSRLVHEDDDDDDAARQTPLERRNHEYSPHSNLSRIRSIHGGDFAGNCGPFEVMPDRFPPPALQKFVPF